MRAVAPQAHGGVEAAIEVVLDPGSAHRRGRDRKEVMSTTTASAPVTGGRSWTHGVRVVLSALAIVVLLAVSFVLGRASVSNAQPKPAAPVPVATAPPSHGHPVEPPCPIGQPC